MTTIAGTDRDRRLAKPGPKRPHWTSEEIETIRALYPTKLATEIARELKRPTGSVYTIAARLGLKRGSHLYRFTPKRVIADDSGNTQELITLRKTSRGIRQFIKIGRKWRFLHHYVWESHNGAIPPGHLVRFRDNNPMHVSIENLYLVSAADLAASFRQTDEYVAARLSRAKGRRAGFDREMYQKVLACPELLSLKRRQLELSRMIKARSAAATQDVPRESPCGGL